MSRKYLLPGLALFGLLFALFMVYYGTLKPPTPKILFPPATPPYKHYVAGAGIVEAASEDISIGTPFNEIVTDVFVKVGERVKVGSPLFALETRTLLAEYEEIKEKREVAQIHYKDKEATLHLYQSLKDKRAVSENAYNQAFFAAESALKQVKELEASLEVIGTKIDRSIIRAPLDGQVLQINVRIGETVDVNPFDNKAHMLFGQTDRLHIRVEIDEDDAWRVKQGAHATAFVRGNSSLKTPLKFLYIEPFIVPKTALTGDNQERVDTRVLQIVYEIDKEEFPVYPGQLLDVYIQGLPANERY
ncbi:MAG: efflux RND transporter periplasmic adaptor subunit [Chlamydiia bacterium]|nr:efflux RND transporter periplasmic adaptor subunit [Chlamydiia bacterium]